MSNKSHIIGVSRSFEIGRSRVNCLRGVLKARSPNSGFRRLSLSLIKTLKEKRSIVVPVVEKLRSRFPVSVASLAGAQNRNCERLGVVSISSDRNWLEKVLESARRFAISGEACVRSTSIGVEVGEE